MCVSRDALLASGVRRIMTVDSNQAGQRRPSGGGGLGRIATGVWGHAESLRGTPKRVAAVF